MCHSKAAASGRELPAADAMALLESALFTAAREAEPRVMAAAGAAFQYLLHVAQGSSAGPSPQVSPLTMRCRCCRACCEPVAVSAFRHRAGCLEYRLCCP